MNKMLSQFSRALLLSAVAVAPCVSSATPWSFSSNPSGATLSVDGSVVGVIPISVDMDRGVHYARVVSPFGAVLYETFDVGDTPGSTTFDLPAQTASVLLLSDPDGASVSMDGVDVGIAPLLLPGVGQGRHRFVFQSAGFRQFVADADVRGPDPHRIFAKLVPTTASLVVISDQTSPSGASVSVNGVFRGKTPLELTGLPDGEAEIAVSFEGYETFKAKVSLLPGETLKVPASLSPLPATVSVTTDPVGAKVFLNNQEKGISPLQVDIPAPGKYVLHVSLSGRKTVARQIQVSPGERTAQHFAMARDGGEIVVRTNPSAVEVFLDGERVGETLRDSVKGAQDANWTESAPLRVPAREGAHTLEFRALGYRPETLEVSVQQDEILDCQTVKLLQRVVVKTRSRTYRGVLMEETATDVKIGPDGGAPIRIPRSNIDFLLSELDAPQEGVK